MAEDRISSDSDNSDLEKRLGRLRPRGLDDAFQARLSRRMMLADGQREQQRILWMRFAPVAGLSLAMLVVAMGVRAQLRQTSAGSGEAPPAVAAVLPGGDPLETSGGAGLRPPQQRDGGGGEFIPVSHENFLKGARDDGIIDTGTPVPARRLRLEFEDAWHWHDPETQTNIRVFRPREEYIMVPVETD